MAEPDGDAAERGLRTKLAELRVDLERLLAVRADVGASIEEFERKLTDLRRRDSELTAQDGALRRQIGELERALEAFESS